MALITFDEVSRRSAAGALYALARSQIREWRRRSRARRLLAGIDNHSLREAGIDPGLAAYEAAQPFWRPILLLRPSDR